MLLWEYDVSHLRCKNLHIRNLMSLLNILYVTCDCKITWCSSGCPFLLLSMDHFTAFVRKVSLSGILESMISNNLASLSIHSSQGLVSDFVNTSTTSIAKSAPLPCWSRCRSNVDPLYNRFNKSGYFFWLRYLKHPDDLNSQFSKLTRKNEGISLIRIITWNITFGTFDVLHSIVLNLQTLLIYLGPYWRLAVLL